MPPQFRQNLLTQEWVIVSPERGKRPQTLSTAAASAKSAVAHDVACPFCPGSEQQSTVETERIEGPSGWIARSIENKFKILDPDVCPVRPVRFDVDGLHRSTPGCGQHEVIIESARHDLNWATMDQAQAEAVVEIYLRRIRNFEANPNNLVTLLFKNHGVRAGASLAHPHAQIVGSRIVPSHLRTMLVEAQRYFDNEGVCLICDMIALERRAESRLVAEKDGYVAFCPYAPVEPFEIWIAPKIHRAGFEDIEPGEQPALAMILRDCLARLEQASPVRNYNLVFVTAPYSMSLIPFFHWLVRVVPRETTPGGFEIGTRIPVNSLAPEDAADTLRRARGVLV